MGNESNKLLPDMGEGNKVLPNWAESNKLLPDMGEGNKVLPRAERIISFSDRG